MFNSVLDCHAFVVSIYSFIRTFYLQTSLLLWISTKLLYFVHLNDNLTFNFLDAFVLVTIGYRSDASGANLSLKMVTKCLMLCFLQTYLVVYFVSGRTLVMLMMPSQITILSIFDAILVELDALRLE